MLVIILQIQYNQLHISSQNKLKNNFFLSLRHLRIFITEKRRDRALMQAGTTEATSIKFGQ